MPVLVDGDKGAARRKRFAPKTRSGCVDCKRRHVKCGEERPSCRRCTVSRLECSYQVPKPWLFDPSTTDSSTDSERRLSQNSPTTSFTEDEFNLTDFYLPRYESSPNSDCDESLSMSNWAGPTMFTSQHQHNAFASWVTFLVRHCEPRSRFPDDVTPNQDVWGQIIPQIAYHSVALREVMIACGILVLSVQRKASQGEYNKDMGLVLSHATRAIQELTSKVRPVIEVVLTAYTFWSLDLMCCHFQSAVMHGLSAVRIADQCRQALASDELASMFVQCLIINLPGPDAGPPPELVKDPPEMRRVKAVVKLEVEYDRVTACVRRVALSDAPSKHNILAILEETRREIQWILSRYNTPELYATWLLHKNRQAADGVLGSSSDTRSGLFQPFVKTVDEYLVTTAEASLRITLVGGQPWHQRIPVDLWRKDAAQETLMFMVMVAGTDLSLRHITMDFFEVSRRIRWPGRSQI